METRQTDKKPRWLVCALLTSTRPVRSLIWCQRVRIILSHMLPTASTLLWNYRWLISTCAKPARLFYPIHCASFVLLSLLRLNSFSTLRHVHPRYLSILRSFSSFIFSCDAVVRGLTHSLFLLLTYLLILGFKAYQIHKSSPPVRIPTGLFLSLF